MRQDSEHIGPDSIRRFDIVSMAKSLWRGWLLALDDIVPDSLRHTIADEQPRAVVLLSDQGARLMRRAHGRLKPSRRRSPRQVIVLLPPEQIAVEDWNVPDLDDAELRSAFALRMPSLSPVPAEKTLLATQRLDHHVARIGVALAPQIERVTGLQADWRKELRLPRARASLISAEPLLGPDGLYTPLLPAREPLKTPSRPALGFAKTAVVSTAILAAFALFAPVLGAERRVAQLEEQVARQSRSHEDLVELRSEIASLEAELSRLDDFRNTFTPLSVRLATLTDALPDHAYALALSIGAEGLEIDGVSGDAAATLATMARSPGLSDVRFAAETRREADGSDRFRIVARWAGASDR